MKYKVASRKFRQIPLGISTRIFYRTLRSFEDTETFKIASIKLFPFVNVELRRKLLLIATQLQMQFDAQMRDIALVPINGKHEEISRKFYSNESSQRYFGANLLRNLNWNKWKNPRSQQLLYQSKRHNAQFKRTHNSSVFLNRRLFESR